MPLMRKRTQKLNAKREQLREMTPDHICTPLESKLRHALRYVSSGPIITLNPEKP
jgi:hypothetical protein